MIFIPSHGAKNFTMTRDQGLFAASVAGVAGGGAEQNASTLFRTYFSVFIAIVKNVLSFLIFYTKQNVSLKVKTMAMNNDCMEKTSTFYSVEDFKLIVLTLFIV